MSSQPLRDPVSVPAPAGEFGNSSGRIIYVLASRIVPGAPTSEDGITDQVILLNETCTERNGMKLQGTFTHATSKYLSRFPHKDGFQSFHAGHGKHTYRYTILKDGAVTFLAFSDAHVRYRVLRAFLEEFHDLFFQRIKSNYRTAPAFGLQNEFDSVHPTLEKLIRKYNDKKYDKITLALEKTDQVRGALLVNIDKLIVRGEMIDILVDKARNVSHSAHEFKSEAVELKKRKACQARKLVIVIVIVVLVVAAIVVSLLIITLRSNPTPAPKPSNSSMLLGTL